MYIETTVINYLVVPAMDDVVPQAQRQVTRQWWDHHRSDFWPCASQFVLDEAAVGNPLEVAERMAILRHVDLLAIPSAAEPLAERLLADGALISKARLEALHMAVATVNGMRYFMTWDCRHLANGVYFVKAVTDQAGEVRKLIIVR